MAESLWPLYHDWMRSLNYERVDYLSCIEGNGSLIDIWLLHKIPRYLFLYHKISFINTYHDEHIVHLIYTSMNKTSLESKSNVS